MKLIHIIAGLSLLTFNAIGQTEQLEIDYLSERYQSGEITQDQFVELGTKWKQLLKDFGGFPTLPYNEETDRIEFNSVHELPGMSKDVIFNRIMEWAAISFVDLSAVQRYDNIETGKIVLKGNFKLNIRDDYFAFFAGKKEGISSVTCHQTYSFTIKDEKLKIVILEIRYEYRPVTPALLSDPYSSPIYVSLRGLYPVTATKPIGWKERLSLLVETDLRIERLVSNLIIHLKAFESDYDF